MLKHVFFTSALCFCTKDIQRLSSWVHRVIALKVSVARAWERRGLRVTKEGFNGNVHRYSAVWHSLTIIRSECLNIRFSWENVSTIRAVPSQSLAENRIWGKSSILHKETQSPSELAKCQVSCAQPDIGKLDCIQIQRTCVYNACTPLAFCFAKS